MESSNGNDALFNYNNNSYHYTTLHAALEAIRDNDTIHIYSGRHSHNTNTTLKYNNVIITGSGSDVTIVECKGRTGFGFTNVINITVSGLTLLGCGQLRNSTTINGSVPSDSVMLFRVALYFVNVTDVVIDNVVVNSSIGMGVAMYDVTGNVRVTNSTFTNNKVPLNELNMYPGGGGFSVEFSYCKLGGYISSNCYNTNEGANYLFYNCSFDHNNASTLNQINSSYPSQTFGLSNQQFGRGGGLSVFFKGHSLKNTIQIFNCTFNHNQAVWGGGYHSDIVDFSTGNVITLENCNFINNFCEYDDSLMTTGTGGGGTRIAFLFYDSRSNVADNCVQFINCRFQFNKAYYGGGLSCRITKENTTMASNSLELISCTWVENIARTGSGVDIISHVLPHGISPVVKIANCNFTANNNSYSNKTTFPSGIGALYADNIPVSFSGNCLFHGNKDSAIAGIDTYFIFSNDTSVVFCNNRGWHGAGMALLGNAYFIVYHNTLLQFINNSAVTKGGAIYYINSGQKDFVSTQRCLMYYYDLSVQNYSNWATKFFFSENSALLGRSIYCTTLLTCIWGNQPGNATVSRDEILQVFNWSGIFDYDNKSNQSEEIATDTADINVYVREHVKIPPGQFYRLNISSVDDRRQIAHPVFFVTTNDTSISSVDNTTTYISDNYIKLHGKRNSSISLHLQSINSRSWSVTFNVILDECPPGFYYPFNDNSETVCECSTSTAHELYGVSDCDNQQLVAKLHPQFWAGYVNLKGVEKLMTSDCPLAYCISTTVQLPPNSSHEALENSVCSNNRNDRVCGKCQQGYYVYTNSPNYQCGRCNDTLSNHGVLVLIVSKYVPLTLMMCFIVFFDISLVDGPLNSFILFCQIFATLPLYDKIGLSTKAQGFASVLIGIADFMYNIWDLMFFEYFVKPFCALKFDSTVPIFVEEYIPAFYVLLLCVIFFIFLPWIYNCCAHSRLQTIQNCALKMERMCIRFRYRWSVRNSVIHSLTTFLILSYARITLVTFKLLTPTIMYGPGGQGSSFQKRVVWFDGTKSYFGSEHLPYALGALLVLIIFVLTPPLLLLSYPLLPMLITRLGVEDYRIVKKLITNPLSKCVPIFDAFQSCYKDKYRFFAGLLFVYRILASAIFAFTPTTALNLAWLLAFLLLVLLLHCICQPYKNKWHNFVEGSIFTILAILTIITFYRLFQAETTNTSTDTSFWMQTVLLYCPLIYFMTYTGVKVFLWLRPRIVLVKDTLVKLCGVNNANPLNVADVLNSREFPARMENDGDNYSTTSESSSEESMTPDDEQQQQQQQQQHQDDDDVEMLYPVEWNDPPHGKSWATL